MSSVFARFIGLSHGQRLTPDAAALLIERRSTLSRCEARVLVYDYLGVTREELSELFDVSIETVRTYWKRIYRKTECRTRKDARAWMEMTLRKEFEQNKRR